MWEEKMIFNKFILLLILLLSNVILLGKEITPNQYYYIIRQLFPDKEKINVFIDKNNYNEIKKDITRASTIFKFDTKLYSIDSPRDIGKFLKDIKKDELLLIFPNELFESSRFKVFILKQTKENGIYLISNYESYSTGGALVAIIIDSETEKTKVLINLANHPDFQIDEQLLTTINGTILQP